MINTIPKKIHFIWLGKEIPSQYINNISNVLATATPGGYQVILWTDNPTRQLCAIQKILDKNNIILHIKDIKSLYPSIKRNFSLYIYVHHGDPTEPLLKNAAYQKKIDILKQESKNNKKYVPLSEFIVSMIAQEIEGFHNYAAASDILRLMILFEHGGIYLDTDTTIKQKLDDYLLPMGEIEIAHDAAINAYPFTMNGKYDFKCCMNDILVSMPQSEIIHNMVIAWSHINNQQANLELPEFSEKNHYKQTPGKRHFTSAKDQRRFGCHGSEYLPSIHAHLKRNYTIDLGPGSAAAGLKEYLNNRPLELSFKTYCLLFVGYLNQENIPLYKSSISDLGGTKFKTNSDQTWLERDENGPKKPRRNEC